MAMLWTDLSGKADAGTLDGDELRLFKKLVKTVTFLAEKPGHPGLASHEISDLTRRYGMKVWQSYLENRKPAAGRIFWVYGPGRAVITVIGLEAHPESAKSRGYERVKLSETRPAKGKG
jgi:hypothetical protein